MGSIRRLPDGELEIMQIIWQLEPPVSRADIEKADSSHAPTTILTFLQRLCDKGYLKMEKQGRSNVYTPLVARQDYLASESRSLFSRLCGGSVRAFAAALQDSGISREELDELRRLLEEGRL